ncbi:phytoene desaturase [Ruania suaedae]|uniref:phytoene desaturase family protein n=1 Tax=Ruania suaedae TaxID=2897774 RepID=UPI001E321265|nr:phytoene desaturase family protein [Ruania suaedae]UFU03284.1 phytoene desaturase [Ruania suaedae]
MSAPQVVAIVGGGIAGLATAALLAADGHEVHLLERQESLGGRAGSWERDGFRFDTGPSWYLMPEVFEHFFSLLGRDIDAELDLRTLDPAYRVFAEGDPAPVEITADTEANIALFEAREAGAGERLRAHLSSAAVTERMAREKFLYTTFAHLRSLLTPDLVRLLPRLAPLLLQSLESMVAGRFSDTALRQILGYPAVFLGTSPGKAPSMYHLMSALDLTGGVQYPMGGFARLIEVVAELAIDQGVTIHLGAEATAITTTARQRGKGRQGHLGPRARVTGVDYVSRGLRRHLEADVVVGATDLHHVETRLLPPRLQTYPEAWWRKRDPGPGAVLAYLGIRGELPELSHHSLFFAADWTTTFADIDAGRIPGTPSAYVCRPSATDPDVAPAGDENLFLLIPVGADPAIGHGGLDGQGSPAVEELVDRMLDEIGERAGVEDLRERVVLRRTVGPADFASDLNAWRGTMLGPAHTLRQSAMFRARNASRRVEGLLYAGSGTIPGVGLPMCLISAELVLKRLRGDTSLGPLAEPLQPHEEPVRR